MPAEIPIDDQRLSQLSSFFFLEKDLFHALSSLYSEGFMNMEYTYNVDHSL